MFIILKHERIRLVESLIPILIRGTSRVSSYKIGQAYTFSTHHWHTRPIDGPLCRQHATENVILRHYPKADGLPHKGFHRDQPSYRMTVVSRSQGWTLDFTKRRPIGGRDLIRGPNYSLKGGSTGRRTLSLPNPPPITGIRMGGPDSNSNPPRPLICDISDAINTDSIKYSPKICPCRPGSLCLCSRRCVTSPTRQYVPLITGSWEHWPSRSGHASSCTICA